MCPGVVEEFKSKVHEDKSPEIKSEPKAKTRGPGVSPVKVETVSLSTVVQGYAE